MKKEVFRIGDKVTIVNPEKFIRCGYPMDFKETVTKMWKKYHKEIREIYILIAESIKGAKPEEWETGIDFYSGKSNSGHVYDKVAEIFASAYMNYNWFGGNERKIYTEKLEIEIDFKFPVIVCGKKIAVTGKRCGCYDSEGGAPYLENRKSNLILWLMHKSQSFWIEAKNVEKVEE